MNLYRLIAISLVATALGGCGTDSALGRAEQSCIKYPTPGARAECDQRVQADNLAFEKETLKNKAAAKAHGEAEIRAQEAAGADAGVAGQGDAKAAAKADVKKNGLCFKRAATGEMVCPN